jgi:hypothetical protein
MIGNNQFVYSGICAGQIGDDDVLEITLGVGRSNLDLLVVQFSENVF